MRNKVYEMHEALEELGRAAYRKKPRKFIWVQTKHGALKILNPKPSFGPGLEYGISGDVKVAPRYQVTMVAP